MRKFETIPGQPSTHTKCIELRCDSCGLAATDPDSDEWVWKNGSGYGSIDYWYVQNGPVQTEVLDLCPECAVAIVEFIKARRKVFKKFRGAKDF